MEPTVAGMEMKREVIGQTGAAAATVDTVEVVVVDTGTTGRNSTAYTDSYSLSLSII